MKRVKSICLVLDDGTVKTVSLNEPCADPVEVCERLFTPCLELTRIWGYQDIAKIYDPDYSANAAEFMQ